MPRWRPSVIFIPWCIDLSYWKIAAAVPAKKKEEKPAAAAIEEVKKEEGDEEVKKEEGDEEEDLNREKLSKLVGIFDLLKGSFH